MPDYDISRQMDLAKLNRKISDPNLPDWEKKKAEEAIYAIRHQSQFKSIKKLRDKMEVAVRRGDSEYAEKIAKEGKKIDRDWAK